jgi:hypothetical protein
MFELSIVFLVHFLSLALYWQRNGLCPAQLGQGLSSAPQFPLSFLFEPFLRVPMLLRTCGGVSFLIYRGRFPAGVILDSCAADHEAYLRLFASKPAVLFGRIEVLDNGPW